MKKSIKLNSVHGITLIALIITIIVLLILAGVTIAALSGNSNILQKAAEALQKDAIAAAKDEIVMEAQEALLNYYNNIYVVGTGTTGESIQEIVESASEISLNNVINSNNNILNSSNVDTDEHKIHIYTKSYKATGTVKQNGVIIWEEIEENTSQQPVANTSATATNATSHTGAALTIEWSKLSSLADIIAETSTIGKTTVEVTVNDGTHNYTLGIGDYLNVYYDGGAKKVRILGFNHDILTSDTTKKAGISFEFTEILDTVAMNPSTNKEANVGGFEATPFKSTLDTTYLGKLKDKANTETDAALMSTYIKPVNKLYNTGDKGTTVETSTGNSLWFLACSEIWTQGTDSLWANCNTSEGDQYAYYASSNADCKKGSIWWLRSPYYNNNYAFMCLNTNGSYFDGDAATARGMAPGFAI